MSVCINHIWLHLSCKVYVHQHMCIHIFLKKYIVCAPIVHLVSKAQNDNTCRNQTNISQHKHVQYIAVHCTAFMQALSFKKVFTLCMF